MAGNGIAVETGDNDTVIAFHTIPGVIAGTQYFVALVIGTTGANLYVNGGLSTNFAADTPLHVSPVPLHLGCHNDDTNYRSKRFFKGRLRDARVYTRLLGADEVARLFADGPV
jgi:hypothetical protein